MTIQIGDTLPSGKLKTATAEAIGETSTDELFKGKTVVLFAVPGAFTPTCDAKHLPGYIEQAAALRAKGVDTIACLSVNDAFVMKAWGKSAGIGQDVLMLADGNGLWHGQALTALCAGGQRRRCHAGLCRERRRVQGLGR